MEIPEHKQNEAEMTLDGSRCPRHGSRVSRYHRCPRCVIEEVRRAERRHGELSQHEEPVIPGSTY
jgi:hypothetical protein